MLSFIRQNAKESHIGDVFHDPAYPTEPLEGFQQTKPMVSGSYNERRTRFYSHSTSLSQVYAGVYPIDGSEYEKLDAALDKLTLNDASVSVGKESR